MIGGMSDKLRRALRTISPLIGVQIFLVGINIATGVGEGFRGGFWAVYPLLAMGIPEFIILTRVALSEDKDESETQSVPAARAVIQPATAATPVQAGSPVDANFASDVARVRSYRLELDRLARNAAGSSQGMRLTDLSRQFADWEKNVQNMAERITGFKRNSIIQQDLRAVPDAIAKLQIQLSAETDPRIRATLQKTLANRQGQLDSLSTLTTTMRHAEVQFESTIASLGTIYTQALAGQGTNQVADYSNLAGEVNDQVRNLDDQLAALEEVRLGRATSNLG